MLSDVDRFRRPNEQAGSMRFRINTQKTDFGRAFAEIGNDLVPFQIGHIFENRPIARHRRRFGCLRTNVGQHEERHGQKNRKREFCFYDRINRSGILFHKKSYPTLAGIGDAGSCPEQGSAIPATVN
jgi:hypothetical protein